MLTEFQVRLGIPVRGFQWLGPILKAQYSHFIQFLGWEGEIYVKGKGILSLPDYYKLMLEKGYCLYADGWMIGKAGISPHYNALHKEHMKRFDIYQEKEAKQELRYPVEQPDKHAPFATAVELYKMGILSKEQLKIRVDKYILPEKRESVFESIIQAS